MLQLRLKSPMIISFVLSAPLGQALIEYESLDEVTEELETQTEAVWFPTPPIP